MSVIVVPYHQDERLGGEHFPLPDGEIQLVAPDLPDGDIYRRLVAIDDPAADRIAAAIRVDGRASVVSGDCLVAMAALAGAQRAGLDPGIVWFDAHGDVHTLDTTASGYLGGLALRFALGAHPELLARPLGVRPVTEQRCVLVGARDLDPPEVAFLAGSAVRGGGVGELDPAALPDGPLLVHVDMDVVDPGELPGLRFPAPGGPPAAEVVAAVRRILGTGRVAVLDIACPWHPPADHRARDARRDLLRAMLG